MSQTVTQPATTGTAPFPSIVIRSDALVPQGSYAEAQAAFLRPDVETVAKLTGLLRSRKIGVAAHFYMDPELQGVLTASDWPHIRISDSLAMADAAVGMVEAGMEAIVVLGVDFMSENVRAVLSSVGHDGVPVYRVASDAIGCSLAESAERLEYGAWLTKASGTPRSLHVVYINTSLRTKAQSHHLVPTITCTSSNVVKTILQAAAQIPELAVWYGPDTYMGHNLEVMFGELAGMNDAAVRGLHPDHDVASLRSLLQRFHYFKQGVCIVHHMFGADVVARLKADYADVLLTAHLEVPGEMFSLAVAAQNEGRGVVGSTSNILTFIRERVAEAVERPGPSRIPVVLGTEAGMITSIVHAVQTSLREHGRDDVEVEIIFPVSSEAVAQTTDEALGIVPGVAGGEGCSIEGGCATCPYMKMNSLDSLLAVCAAIGTERQVDLEAFKPQEYTDRIGGHTVAELGGKPILHMRHLQQHGELPEALVQRVLSVAVD